MDATVVVTFHCSINRFIMNDYQLIICRDAQVKFDAVYSCPDSLLETHECILRKFPARSSVTVENHKLRDCTKAQGKMSRSKNPAQRALKTVIESADQ